MSDPHGSPRWYAVAVAACGAALAFDLALSAWVGPNVFPPFLVAVLLCARRGGTGPGLAATLISLPACAILLAREARPAPAEALAIRLAMFAAVDLLIVRLMVARSRADEAVDLLRMAVEQSPASVVVTDQGGIIEYVNPRFTAVTGYAPGEVLGRNPRILKGGTMPPEAYRSLWTTIAGGSVWRGEFCNRAKDGRLYWESASISPVRDRRGEVAHYVAVKEDITERKRADEALRESERRFRAMAESVPDLVWVARADGEITYLSGRWGPLDARRPSGPDGLGGLASLHPDDRTRCLELWRECVRTGAPFQVELRLHGVDGEYRWYLARALPSRDEAGRVADWFGTCTDIDAHKRLHAALVEATEAKDRFLAVLSHELRTPLAPVLLAVGGLMERSGRCRACRSTLEMIRSNVELEARLIDDLLDVSRIARGELGCRFEVVEMHAIVQRAAAVCRGELESRGHRLEVELAAKRHHVRGDPVRLQQVLWNLLTNAARYTPEGGRIVVRTRDEPGGRLVVEVTDDGRGIEPEELPRLFQAFERGVAAVASHARGLGLGLAISRSIVAAHGGELTGASRGRGLGSTFTIALACVDAPSDVSGPAAGGRAGAAGPMRILLAEDNAASSRVLAEVLGSRGHRVRVAGSLKHALQAAEAGEFDLLISDLDLGDGSGLDLIRAFRERSPAPAIALSGYAGQDDERASLAAGFEVHLAKPITITALEAAIRAAVDGQRLRRCGPGQPGGSLASLPHHEAAAAAAATGLQSAAPGPPGQPTG